MNTMQSQRITEKSHVPLLVIEDCDQDYTAISRVFSKAGITNPLFRAATGEDGLDYLMGQGRHAGNPGRPGLIILDLNLPGISGKDVLATIKADAKLRGLPVLIFTSSPDPDDVRSCYQEGANTYLMKPSDPQEFATVVDRMRTYWLGHGAVLPNIELM